MKGTEKRRSVEIQVHATIKAKRLRNDVDLSKCIVCQGNSQSDSLVENSSTIKNLFDKTSERVSYHASTYVSLKQIILLDDKEDEEKVFFSQKMLCKCDPCRPHQQRKEENGISIHIFRCSGSFP